MRWPRRCRFCSAERVLMLYGDVPLIEAETLQRLLGQGRSDRQLALLTVNLADPDRLRADHA